MTGGTEGAVSGGPGAGCERYGASLSAEDRVRGGCTGWRMAEVCFDGSVLGCKCSVSTKQCIYTQQHLAGKTGRAACGAEGRGRTLLAHLQGDYIRFKRRGGHKIAWRLAVEEEAPV